MPSRPPTALNCSMQCSVVVWSCPLELHRNMFIQHNEGQNGMGAKDFALHPFEMTVFCEPNQAIIDSIHPWSHAQIIIIVVAFVGFLNYASLLLPGPVFSWLVLSLPWLSTTEYSVACLPRGMQMEPRYAQDKRSRRQRTAKTHWLLLLVLILFVDCFSMANGN